MSHFRAFTPEELKFVSGFKRGELVAETGATILNEGAHSAQLFTVLSGWAFRFKTLEDGRRQILNYVLPGDLIGLQGTVIGEMEHSVEALSPVVLSRGTIHAAARISGSQRFRSSRRRKAPTGGRSSRIGSR